MTVKEFEICVDVGAELLLKFLLATLLIILLIIVSPLWVPFFIAGYIKCKYWSSPDEEVKRDM